MGPEQLVALAFAAVLPTMATIACGLLQRKAWFCRLGPWIQVSAISVVFAIVAAVQSVIGIPVAGGLATIALSAPVCAAINFGWRCGILTGVLGAIWLWCAGPAMLPGLSLLAAPIAMLIVGANMSLLGHRQGTRRPAGPLTSLVIACVAQAIYWSLILVMQRQDVSLGYTFVIASAGPVLVATVVTVGSAWLAGTLMSGADLLVHEGELRLNDALSLRLFGAIAIAFVVTVASSLAVTRNTTEHSADMTLRTSLESTMNSVDHSLDSAMRREAGRYAALIDGNSPTDEDLSALLARVRNASRGHEGTFAELEIAGPDGIIAHGTNPAALGFDLHTDERSQEFLEALATRGAYVQEFGPVAWDAGAEMKYVGVPMGDGLLLLGLDREGYEAEVASQVRTITYDLPIGRGGGIVCATRDGRLVSASASILGAHVTSDVGELVAGLNEYEARHASIFGIDCRSMYADYHGFRLIALYPTSEIGLLRNISTLGIALLMAIIFSALFLIVRIEQDRIVVRRIHSLGDTLAAITDGDLTAQADVRGIAEFSELSDDINATVDALEDLIEEVRDQYAKDLDTARTIQRSALPSVFPPYPHRKEFSLFASMDAAREVGGDFYDYFFIDAHRLVIVVADVSDKGIPASLFMMTAKTLIHSLARSGLSVDEVAAKANEQLCRNNEADMFVTVWLGVLDLRSGHMDFVDAGHTVPCVYRAEGEDAGRFTYISQRRNLFVGGVEGATYRRQELELSPGDALFVYSDGVTEATNQDEEVFGDDRLLASLDRRVGGTCEELCEGVKQDVLDFTGEAEQSDDITVLALLYRQRETSDTSHAGERVVGELNILTSEDAVDEVMRFVEKTLGKTGCADELIDRTCVVVDEVVSNVVRFAYEGKPGRLSVSLETRQGGSVVRLSFSDEGVPFDPLSNPEPDVSLPLEERPIGGLGIHLTKAYSDELGYDRVDDLNVLTVTLSRR